MANEIAKLFVTLGLDDKEFQTNLKSIQKDLTNAGKIMTGLGAGITASLGLATKAALDEQIGINQLSQSLKNVGANYNALSTEIEGSIAATQKKTSYGDGEQRAALSELVSITGTYTGSLEQLQLATDLAAAKGMDLNAAATLVGKAMIGETGTLSRYGIIVEKGATATEIMAQMQERFNGAAEAAADPLQQLKNSFGDVAEDIGSVLVPLLKDIVAKILPIIDNVRKWMADNPELTKTLVIVAAAIGGVMTVVGPLLMILPTLAGLFTALLGPVGLIIIAFTALVAIGTLIVLNWETIKAKAVEIWTAISNFFSDIWNSIVGFFQNNWDKILAILFPAVGIPILIARNWDTIKGYFSGLWEDVKGIFKGAVNWLIGIAESFANSWINGINLIINALNSLKVAIPDWVPDIGGKTFGVNITPLAPITLPRLAAGGIVTSPTLALIGEAGPEAVVPLSGGGMGGLTININNPSVRRDSDIDAIAQAIVSKVRLQTGLRK